MYMDKLFTLIFVPMTKNEDDMYFTVLLWK